MTGWVQWVSRGTAVAVSLALLGGCALLEKAGLDLDLGMGRGDAVASANPPAETGDDATPYAQGRRHLVAGRLGLAVAAFRAAVARDPGSLEALNGLGAAYDRMGRYDLAARAYEKALALDPGAPRTLNNIGVSYLMQNRLDRAVAFLRGAQARARADSSILANRRVAEAALARAGGPPVRGAVRGGARRGGAAAGAPRGPFRPRIERTSRGVQSLITQPPARRERSALPANAGPDMTLGYLAAPMGGGAMARAKKSVEGGS
ncbi:MAG: tetratricopeptide repeat protein [Kiloniellaceae bacterium]